MKAGSGKSLIAPILRAFGPKGKACRVQAFAERRRSRPRWIEARRPANRPGRASGSNASPALSGSSASLSAIALSSALGSSGSNGTRVRPLAAQRLDRRDQRAGLREPSPRPRSPVTPRCSASRSARIAAIRCAGACIGRQPGVDQQVAFAVEAHRAVVQVGRADAQQLVVDDHDLGVDVDVLAALGHRRVDAEAAVAVGLRRARCISRARAGLHHLLLEPAVGRSSG